MVWTWAHSARGVLSSGAKCNPGVDLKGLDIPSCQSLFPGNRAEGRRSEWETRLFVEKQMLSTGLHFGSESTGALGKYIIVIPDRDLVVAFVNHTEFPDGPQAAATAEIKKLPDVRVPDMGKLFKPILMAQHQ